MSDPNQPPSDGDPSQPPRPGEFRPPQPGPPQPGPPIGPGQFPPPHTGGPPFPDQSPAQPFVPGYDREGWVPELGVRIAPAGARIGAKAIDIVIVVLLNMAVSVLAVAVFVGDDLLGDSGSFTTSATGGTGFGISVGAALLLQLVLVAIDLVYNVVIPARFGGQPGKLMLGLRIIRQDGRPIDAGVAFRRWSPVLALIVLSLIPVIGLIASLGRLILLAANLAMVLTDERRRDVFDHVASTYVITTR